MRSVIFDLDGTLADTSGDLIEAANACFRSLGHGEMLEPVADATTSFLGGRAMLRLGFERLGMSGEALEQAVAREYAPFLTYYETALDVYTDIYPGVEATLERLRADGLALGVCSNKPEGLTELLLRQLGLRGAFDAVVGSSTLRPRKPDPAPLHETLSQLGGTPAQSVLVGDSTADREAARAAGMPCILVTFGPEGRKVAALEPEALLDQFEDLPDLVARLLPS